MFKPKQILSESDWLACHKEKGQTFDEFLKSPKRNKVTRTKSKVYLNITDPSISEEFTQKLFKYCSAFYTGIEVKLLKCKSKDFMKANRIAA